LPAPPKPGRLARLSGAGEDLSPLVTVLAAHAGPQAARHRAPWAFDARLAHVARTTSEPTIGQMRLAWWNDVIDDADARKGRGEPVVDALRTTGAMAAPGLVAIGIGTGLACGAFNGILVAGLNLPSIVVTIGTMSLFRGISYIVLGDQAYGKYPADFAFFGQGYVFWVFSFEFVLFLVMAGLFAVLLHATNFGRQVYVIGNNPLAARFSGIPVERVKFILFLLTGLMSGIAAVCLTSRLGSTRPSIAQGWELEVVTMGVLGGVAIL